MRLEYETAASKMRLILTSGFAQVAALVTVLTCSVALAQGPRDPDLHMSCIERLEVPAYPRLATQARIEGGPFRVSIQLSDGGSVESVTIDGNSKFKKLFDDVIQASLEKSAFHSNCRLYTITLLFSFTLGDRATVAFKYPNQFSISGVAEHWQPETSQLRH